MGSDHARIRSFVTGHLDGQEVADEEDLFATGLVSSLFAVQIVVWVQDTFDLELTSDDLEMTNFRSIAAITDFVARRRVAAGR